MIHNQFILFLLVTIGIVGCFFFFQKEPEQSEASFVRNDPSINNASITSGLVGHWTFDGPDVDWSNTGTEIADRGSGSNDGDASSMLSLSKKRTVFEVETPSVTDTDGVEYELGMKFQSDTDGYITGIRFWKAVGESGTHTGRIWSAGGSQLASVTFSGETSSGWQEEALATPLSISASTTYVVSVNTANYWYVYTSYGLSSQITNGHLSTIEGNNGVYGTSGTFPTGTFEEDTNFFRDVVFNTTSVYEQEKVLFPVVAGKIGQGITFNGSDDDVVIGDPVSGVLDFDASSSFSYGAWIKSSDYDSFAVSKRQGGSGYEIVIGKDSTPGNWVCRVYDGSGDTVYSAEVTADTTGWNHLLCVIDRNADELLVYLNGAVVGSATDISSEGSFENTSDLTFGNRSEGGGTDFLDGFMDDVRIYSRALSPSEVQYLYQLGR